MRIVSELSEEVILKELSTRFKQYRIDSNIPQTEAAKLANVSVHTISRFEKGKDVSVLTLFKLFKAMGIANHLDVLLPDMSQRPSSFFENNQPKQRASKKTKPMNEKWQWGDDK